MQFAIGRAARSARSNNNQHAHFLLLFSTELRGHAVPSVWCPMCLFCCGPWRPFGRLLASTRWNWWEYRRAARWFSLARRLVLLHCRRERPSPTEFFHSPPIWTGDRWIECGFMRSRPALVFLVHRRAIELNQTVRRVTSSCSIISSTASPLGRRIDLHSAHEKDTPAVIRAASSALRVLASGRRACVQRPSAARPTRHPNGPSFPEWSDFSAGEFTRLPHAAA
jgi:hypothetical protein